MTSLVSRLGIIQGRALPPLDNFIQAYPLDNWRDEFYILKRLNLKKIEWIITTESLGQNDFIHNIEAVKKISKESFVEINSVTLDYYMNTPAHKSTSSKIFNNILEITKKIINNCTKVSCKYAVIPILEISSIDHPSEEDKFVEFLQELLPTAIKNNVKILLETDSPPIKTRSLLNKLPDQVAINLDTGNSCFMGYSLDDEFRHYGDRILNIHIKDRTRNGPSVPISKGSVDFQKLFSLCRSNAYQGNFILQAAREVSHKEEETLKNYVNILGAFYE